MTDQDHADDVKSVVDELAVLADNWYELSDTTKQRMVQSIKGELQHTWRKMDADEMDLDEELYDLEQELGEELDENDTSHPDFMIPIGDEDDER